MSNNNLKNPPRPCRLIHPMFIDENNPKGVLDFRSLKHAAGWLGKEVLQEYYGRTDMGIDYGVLSFLINHKIVLQSQDPNFPLNGLIVTEGFKLKSINKSTNQETDQSSNKVNKQLTNQVIDQSNNQLTDQLTNQAIDQLIKSSGNDFLTLESDPLTLENAVPKVRTKNLLDNYKNVFLLD